jgi:integrase
MVMRRKEKNFAIPLNQEAIAALRNQVGIHQEYVFAFNGKPIKYINYYTWREILSKAGIDNFRFHDLRHTWASWHVQSGTSLQEIMELGAWSDFSMALRYAHLSSDRLKDAAENIVAKPLQNNVIENYNAKALNRCKLDIIYGSRGRTRTVTYFYTGF